MRVKPFVVESPCSEPWETMRPVAGSARHCASCDKAVFDLSRMTESAIRGVAVLTDGSFCGRQIIRNGALVVQPPPVAPRSPWALRVVTRGAVVAGALALAACDGVASATPSAPPVVVIAGDPQPGDATPTPPPPLTRTPDPDPPHILAGGIRQPPPEASTSVQFARGSAKLPKSVTAQLVDVAAALEANPWIGKIAIVAHAGPDEGKPANRQALARARAKAVADFFVKHGVPATQLIIKSDVASHTTSANRQVQVRLCNDADCP